MVPLRPLTLGDMFGGALKTIRHNPKATVGMATLVTFGFMLIPIVATVLLGAADGLPSMDPLDTESGSTFSDLGTGITSVVNIVFSLLSGIVVTGLVVRTVEQAVIGRPITAGQAWRQSKGRMFALLRLVLVVLFGMLLVIGLPITAGVVVALTASARSGWRSPSPVACSASSRRSSSTPATCCWPRPCWCSKAGMFRLPRPGRAARAR